MALPGGPPQENKRRRNADTFNAEKIVLPTEAELIELKKIPEGDWLPEVQLWWRVWTTCAQSALFTVTDWMRLRTLIITLQSYHVRPTPQKMAEIRQTEGLWGATYVDRMKARIKITMPGQEDKPAPAGTTSIDEYRKRLAG